MQHTRLNCIVSCIGDLLFMKNIARLVAFFLFNIVFVKNLRAILIDSKAVLA